ncbi:hypothetical protein J4526_00725 [Desulfurococcaceae archaeon MEX13E-LK6-19]|nr:hypothetical protein J4526_00725 [Desulfurococcaceae archaeon MEX13E-LK6-19]
MKILEKPAPEIIALFLLITSIYILYSVATTNIITYNGYLKGYADLEETVIDIKGYKISNTTSFHIPYGYAWLDLRNEEYYTLLRTRMTDIRTYISIALNIVIILVTIYTLLLIAKIRRKYITWAINLIFLSAAIILLTILIPVYQIHNHVVAENIVYCNQPQQVFISNDGVLETIIVYNKTTVYCIITPPETTLRAIIMTIIAMVLMTASTIYKLIKEIREKREVIEQKPENLDLLPILAGK